MDSAQICFLSARRLSTLIQKKELSPVEITQAYLARIEALEPKLNSFITVLQKETLEAARNAETEIQKGNYRGPLHGIPVGLKDLFDLKGVRTTSGSKLFHEYVPGKDSTIAGRLKEAGAVILGKQNMTPFARGTTGENPDYGDMHNPWNPECVSGGSSGGSASATAAGECPFAVGSDTGGSIRVPSALCGVVGLKPTYGRISRYGVHPLAWSLDTAGPIARTVEDCALLLKVIAGYDPRDPSSSNLPVPDYEGALTGNIKGVRIGVPKEYFETPLDEGVKESVIRAMETLEALGANITELSWPLYLHAVPMAIIILMTEANGCYREIVRRHASRLYPPLRLTLEGGFFVSASDYLRAQQARTLIYRQGLELLDRVDVLAGPTLPLTAFKIGLKEVEVGNVRMDVTPAMTQYTRPFNLTGFPAITVPCNFSKDGLPVGLQLAGRPFDEATVLRVAHAYEQNTEWHNRRPTL